VCVFPISLSVLPLQVTSIRSHETIRILPHNTRHLQCLAARHTHTLPDTFDISSTDIFPSTTVRDDKLDCIRIPSALITQDAQDFPDVPSSHIVTQPRESENGHHTTSRILKAPVGSPLTTSMRMPALPNATRSPLAPDARQLRAHQHPPILQCQTTQSTHF